jgi:hypothetical protein
VLRRELAEPDLAFKGRPERIDEEPYDDSDVRGAAAERPAVRVFIDPSSSLDAPEGGTATSALREEWTIEGLTELLHRLEQERPLQADVIRAAAARRRGRITRRQVYRLGGYDPDRSLRGFTRPSNRITRQMQHEGMVGHGVDFPLRAVFGQGGVATHFVVPPEVIKLLGGN